MRQVNHELAVDTRGRGLYDVTPRITAWVGEQGLRDGLLTVFVRHTSASLVIQENADADVLRDLETFFDRLAPESESLYRHTSEGPDDMPAHIRSALTQTHLAIPLADGRLVLGTWQGVYLFEHRNAPHARRLALHLIGA